jgi:hypothetical protein
MPCWVDGGINAVRDCLFSNAACSHLIYWRHSQWYIVCHLISQTDSSSVVVLSTADWGSMTWSCRSLIMYQLLGYHEKVTLPLRSYHNVMHLHTRHCGQGCTQRMFDEIVTEYKITSWLYSALQACRGGMPRWPRLGYMGKRMRVRLWDPKAPSHWLLSAYFPPLFAEEPRY